MTATRGVSHRSSGNRLELSEILALEGRGFIADAYRFALGREPDAEGLEFYIRRLRAGYTKRQILAQLYLSREARVKGHFHPELARLAVPYRIGKFPVLGWLMDLALMIQTAVQGPRFARAAMSNASLVGEELHARLDVMEQRLALLCTGRAGTRGVGRALTAAPAAIAAPRGSAERLTLEDLVDLSRRIRELNQST